MLNRTKAHILLIVILETLIAIFCFSINSSETYFYQLAARYSARLSFFFLAGILLWMGLSGLKSIYSTEPRRTFYVSLLLMLMVNHLIHFGFLAMNYRVNDLSLMDRHSIIGVIAYLAICLAPFYLWNRSPLTGGLVIQIYAFLAGITFIFTFSYIGRLSSDLPFATPRYYFIAALTAIAFLVVLNIYRIASELGSKGTSDTK